MGKVRDIPVQARQQRLYCECGREMKYTGVSKSQLGVVHQHLCEKCFTSEWPTTRYPNIVYEPIKQQGNCKDCLGWGQISISAGDHEWGEDCEPCKGTGSIETEGESV